MPLGSFFVLYNFRYAPKAVFSFSLMHFGKLLYFTIPAIPQRAPLPFRRTWEAANRKEFKQSGAPSAFGKKYSESGKKRGQKL